ncbi:cobalamin biosynthesis protein CobW [Agromyces albus]|uniref:Cobalamin biosynthesis protein CobW n=1 Tax=Agromyces albus TaxID=205332 RepID=A0A4Q2L0Y1_9MICO|nr:cobalamin biosynthesis protein CobW [Agromyces albus]
MQHDPPNRGAGPVLGVTLVSGLRSADRSRFAALATGTAATQQVHPSSAGHQDFPLELADHLLELAARGHAGRVVVDLDPRVDCLEAGLVLRHLFAAEASDGVRVQLRELVTTARVADIRRWLFREGPDHTQQGDYDTSERLAAQLESASTIILADLTDAPSVAAREVIALLNRLNPTARILPPSEAEHPAARSVPSGDRLEALGRDMGWMLELEGRAGLPSTIAGIGAFVFRDPRPFHPTRLGQVVEHFLDPEDAGLIVRSRGLVRLASRPGRVGSWSTAGRVLSLDPTAMLSWDADSPQGQELVFFGRELQAEYLSNVLGAALLADDELLAGPMEWARYRDPFPAWELEHDH